MSESKEIQNLKQRLFASKSGRATVKYKRLYLSGNGKEFNIRLLDPSAIDPEGNLFATVYLHGGFYHPNYQHDYPSTFHCGGKNCPLCEDAKQEAQKEEAQKLPTDQRQAWRKRCKRYTVYWGINLDNNELSLIHVPASAPRDKESVQDILFNTIAKAVEQDMNPFAAVDGHNISISSKKVNNQDKWNIKVDPKKTSIESKFVAMMEKVKILSQVYKTYSQEHLLCVAEGRPIKYDQDETKEEVKSDIGKVVNEDHGDFESDLEESDMAQQIIEDPSNEDSVFFEETFEEVPSDSDLDDKLESLFSDDDDN